MEHKSWWKSVTYAPAIDYVSFHANELLYVLAIEKLLGIEVPRRATWARMAMAELNRIHSHLVWLGTSALELGAISLFWYCFDDRDQILDLFEMAGGTRMHTRYVQVGGLAEDLPPDFTSEARKFCESMPKSVDEYEAILDRNAIWLERTKGVGLLSADDALALAQSGPMLRASGVDWDLRRNMPYLAYDEVEFDVPVYPNGDVYDRYRVHMDEMRESVRIVRQCLDRLDRDGRRAVDRRRPQGRPAAAARAPHVDGVAHPPLQDRHRGLHRSRGRGLRRDRVAARRDGCYLVSDGGARPGA
jgi:NADH-quinone oxidoreductase subunit D